MLNRGPLVVAQVQSGRIGHIEIKAGRAGWHQAAPLLRAVWPADVIATLPWRDVVWAEPDWRVLVFNLADEIVGHAAMVIRDGIWDGRAVKIGGVGGVATREDSRQQGVARAAISKALQDMQNVHRADFALLFCEPRHGPIYEKLGWHPFKGDVFVTEPRGYVRFDVTEPHVFDLEIAPRSGLLDLCGLPW
jgi:aminoglycoside 2'-N-acetyltransferase I